MRLRDLVVLVICFSVVGGLLDSAALHLQNAMGQGFDYIPRGHAWMSSVSFLLLLSIPALAVWLLGRLVAGLFGSERFIVALLTTVVVVGVASNYHPELAVWAILIFSLGIGVQAWRSAAARKGRLLRLARRAVVPLGVLVIAIAAASALRPRVGESLAIARLPEARPEARSILLIILDTVRARNMSLYGYERLTTPFLDELAESSVVFERAYAPSSWTLPTHASIFTGLQPYELSANWITRLDEEPATLAEVFTSRGFRSAGFIGNQNYTGTQTGLQRGFQHYEARHIHPRTVLGASALGRLVLLRGWRVWSWDKVQRKPGAAVTDQFLAWLPDPGERPFFAFLNYFDAHDPYEPPAPFETHFKGDEAPVRPIHGPRRPRLQSSIRRYDASIAYLDAELRRLMTELARRGHLENTVVVITSDHGEEFAEKGIMIHGNNLNLFALHVPLLVVSPDQDAGARLRQPVNLRDLAATLLELSRSAAETVRTLPGRSFAPTLSALDPDSTPELLRADTVLAELTGFRKPRSSPPVFEGYLVSAITDSLHYVVDQAGQENLFLLEEDWWEQEDVAGHPEYRTELDRLREWVRPAAESWEVRTVPPPGGDKAFPGRVIDPTPKPAD